MYTLTQIYEDATTDSTLEVKLKKLIDKKVDLDSPDSTINGDTLYYDNTFDTYSTYNSNIVFNIDDVSEIKGNKIIFNDSSDLDDGDIHEVIDENIAVIETLKKTNQKKSRCHHKKSVNVKKVQSKPSGRNVVMSNQRLHVNVNSH